MVAKGTKRKLSEEEVVAEKCSELTKVITDAADLPADVVKMLVDVLPHSLGQPKDKRHRFQEQAISAVDGVMRVVEESLKKTMEESRAKVLEAKHQAAPSETAVAESELRLRQESERFVSETKTLAQTALEFRAARTAVHEAEKSLQTGDEDFKVALKKKAELQAIADDIEPLKSGMVPEADVEKRCNKLLSALKQLELGFDEAMLLVLQTSLAKAPSQRGQFDNIGIDQLDKYMAKHVAPVEEVINAGEAGKQQRATAVESAKKAFEEALKAQKLRATGFESTWTSKKDSERSLETARQALKDLASQTKSCDKALYKAEAESDVFQEFVRSTFEELKERTTPEPVEPELTANTSDNTTETTKLEGADADVPPVAITA